MKGQARRGWWGQTWPLACLCVLVASRWLAEGADPRLGSTDWTQALGCVLAATALVSANRLRSPPSVARAQAGGERTPVRHVAAGALLSVGTMLVMSGAAMAEVISGRQISPGNATLALAMTPVVVAVLSVVLAATAGGDLTGRLWPGLAGLMGLLLLLPQPAFSGARPWGGLVALPLLTGVGAMLLTREPEADVLVGRRTESFAVGGGCLLAAAVFAAIARQRQEAFVPNWTWRGACLDAALFGLTLIALRRLSVPRWSAQFLLIPLLGFGEGLIFLRPLVDFRSWIGLTLLAAGGLRQLFLEPEDTAGGTSLRVPPA